VSSLTEFSSDIVAPPAAAMIEALRALGYSTASALADIVDNSISAGADSINILLLWQGRSSSISILDNGQGMGAATLRNAMRAGSSNPRDSRRTGDLGRFGMGLKTASFSQCRSLTVASKHQDSEVHVRRWDLDHVAQTGEWELLHGFRRGSEHHVEVLKELSSGTLVLWEETDRVTGAADVANEGARKQFYSLARRVEQHLAMTFHRFLMGRGKREITINDNLIQPWDPFLSDREGTECLPEERLCLNGQLIYVQGYVLPHHTRLNSAEFEAAAGPRGWNGQQGFYVYRDRRLLVSGGWLGLKLSRDDRFRLARVRIDLPTTLDHDWGVDIRKSSVTVPSALRDGLLKVAERTRERALQVYRHRGRTLKSKQTMTAPLWDIHVLENRQRHVLNRQHPLIQVLRQTPGTPVEALNALLDLVEVTLPVERIWLSEATRDQVDQEPAQISPPDSLQRLMEEIFLALVASGLPADQARIRVAGMEPFCNYPELILHQKGKK
jgi:hypothetical protein